MRELNAIRFEVDRLWFSYPEQEPALRGVSYVIEPGAFIGLIGQNGSGKTTLVKHLNGLLRPTRGSVLMDGKDICDLKVATLASSVGYLYQNPDEQICGSSVREELAFAPRNLGVDEAEVSHRVDTLLKRFELETLADLPPSILSFGLRRKITAAAVFAAQTPLLVLDEPTSGLDWNEAGQVMEHVLELNQSGRSVVLISHDMRLIAKYAKECVVLDRGQILTHGKTREVFSQTNLLQEVHLNSPQITQLAERLSAFGVPGDTLSVDECCRRVGTLLGGGS